MLGRIPSGVEGADPGHQPDGIDTVKERRLRCVAIGATAASSLAGTLARDSPPVISQRRHPAIS